MTPVAAETPRTGDPDGMVSTMADDANDPLSLFSAHQVPEDQAESAYQGLMDSLLPTSYYVQIALNNDIYGGRGGGVPLWGGIAASREEAKEYYDSIEDEDELRSEAASILAYGNWDRKKVGFKFS